MLKQFKASVFVIAINKFITDTDAEVTYLQEWCNERGYAVSLTEVWEKGGQGGVDLAEKVLKEIEKVKTTTHHFMN